MNSRNFQGYHIWRKMLLFLFPCKAHDQVISQLMTKKKKKKTKTKVSMIVMQVINIEKTALQLDRELYNPIGLL